ncbi:MAG: CPBP family intramembrane metalloprotease [Sphingobacteriaceae bacterium]|nr:MAG: CPBP family intramembrane metalloprotease [Sphingobacteriaceae bacterium]
MIFLLNNWIKVFKFIFFYALIVGLFQYLGSLFCGIDLSRKSIYPETPAQESLMLTFNLLGTVLATWLFSVSVRKHFILKLGLNSPKLRFIVIGFLTGFTVMLFGLAILLLTDQINIKTINFSLNKLLISIYIFAIVALLEEVLIRGYILNILLQNSNKWFALGLSALLFSAMHLFNAHLGYVALINLFLAGILLGLPVIYTGNIWSSVALHFSWNFFQSLVGFNISGKNLYSLITLNEPNANLWNGGLFGYEASVYCIMSQVIAIACYVNYSAKNGGYNYIDTKVL